MATFDTAPVARLMHCSVATTPAPLAWPSIAINSSVFQPGTVVKSPEFHTPQDDLRMNVDGSRPNAAIGQVSTMNAWSGSARADVWAPANPIKAASSAVRAQV